MTDLDVIRAAYDRVGIGYVVLDGESGWQYLVLAGEKKRQQEFRRMPLNDVLRERPFMEFRDGKVASY